jgi:hypothetical protein
MRLVISLQAPVARGKASGGVRLVERLQAALAHRIAEAKLSSAKARSLKSAGNSYRQPWQSRSHS